MMDDEEVMWATTTGEPHRLAVPRALVPGVFPIRGRKDDGPSQSTVLLANARPRRSRLCAALRMPSSSSVPLAYG